MKVKLEASKGSYFIIPMKAFDLIKNLPDGEIDISATDKNVVMIKIGAIKNKYQSYPPEEFNFDITEDPEADGVELNGKKIMEAISHVIYAAADGGANTQMTGIYFEGTDSGVSLAALDGHMVAVDSVKAEGAKDMKLIVPKATAKKLISMGVIDDVTLTYTKNSAVFKSDEYTIYTNVIVTVKYDNGECRTNVAHTVDGRWKLEIRILNAEVIAWKEMPEPYKEDKNV